MREHVALCGCFPTGKHYPGIAHLLRILARGTVAELDGDASWVDLPIAFIDTETTGIDPAKGDRIIEIGVVVGQRGEISKRLNWLLNPGMPIPEEATKVHGISNDDVKDAPTFAAIVGDLIEAVKGCIPAAYNAAFDRAFVASELARSGLLLEAFPSCLRSDCEWLDPLVWAREIQKYEKGRKLADVASRLGISLENAHRAADDAEAALRVLYAFASDARVPRGYAAIVQEQRRIGRIQEEELRAWRQRNPRP